MSDETQGKSAEKKRKKAEGKALKKKIERKAKKPSKPPVEVKWQSSHELVGQKGYTRHGAGEVTKAGFVEGKVKPERLMIKIGRKEYDVKATSFRTTAIDDSYREKYAVDKEVRTASGKPSIGVKDEIGNALKGKALEDIHKIAKENNLDPKRWSHLNPGMQRMNLGNALRGYARKGWKVVVLGKTIVKGGMPETEKEAA